MRTLYVISTIWLAFFHTTIVCPPVDQTNEIHDPDPNHVVNNETDQVFNLEYGRYLAEVVKVLETDKEFANQLKNVSSEDIRQGNIAKHLDLVDHKVRSKLDELKRIEIDRLRKLTLKKDELEHGIDRENVINDHVGDKNDHRFEIEDLKKLIQAATRDLEKLHEVEKEDFKKYEMEKEFEFQQGIKNMTEEEKKNEIKHHEEEKHRKHPAAHHPGSKAQLEQVWEEEDHMNKEDFDPKTFFAMHDLNGDGVLDEREVEALLQLEARKMFMSDPQHPGDPRSEREMHEEINRMREHVFKEVDKNKDGLVSRQEFLDMAESQEFEHDEGWKGLDEQQPVYTQEELQRFMQMREQEMQMQMNYGYYPGVAPNMQYHPGYAPQGVPQQGYHPGMPAQQVVYQGMPQGVQQHVPQGYHGYAPPPQQVYHNQPQVNPQIPNSPQIAHQQQLPPPKVTAGQQPHLNNPPQQNNQQYQQPPARQGQQQFNQQPPQQQFNQNAPQQQFNQNAPQQQFNQNAPQQQQFNQNAPQQQQFNQNAPQQQMNQQFQPTQNNQQPQRTQQAPQQNQQFQQQPSAVPQQQNGQQFQKPQQNAAPAANVGQTNQQSNQYQQQGTRP